ncbi:MAG: sugar phosphate isomerase/epimerase [Chloroflexi bacterium]|nr:MAG: sugar phosphate isomerase/epimerase [Chloroflexota bacterium]
MRTFGIEIFYWIDNWADDQTAWFARAAECGFEAVEISLISGPDIDIAPIRAELDRLGLDVFCSMGLPLEMDITSPDAATRRAGIEYLKRCVQTAHKLGSPILGGLPHVPWLHFPNAADLRPYRERSAAAIREVAAVAGDLGVTISLEIINRFETYIFNTVAEGLAYLEIVDHPAVKLHLDTYHMNMEEDNIAAAIRAAGPHIGHFHCAAGNRKLPGRGQIDWPAIRQALDAVNYRGGLVIETFPNPNAETGRTVNVWRPLVQDYDAEARQSLAFLRQYFA